MMLSKTTLEQIRRLEFRTRRVLQSISGGEYRSRFRGQGSQFAEHRQYVPGDDPRHINWKLSARTKEPMFKLYEEERELAVLLVVDVSASMRYGARVRSKWDQLIEVVGAFAFIAQFSNDQVGLLAFSDEVECVLPPKKGSHAALHLLTKLCALKPQGKGSDLTKALPKIHGLMKHGGIVAVFSDFESLGSMQQLKSFTRRHEVVGFRITEGLEEGLLPEMGGLIPVEDMETNETVFISWKMFKKELEMKEAGFLRDTWKGFKNQIDVCSLRTDEDCLPKLVHFFQRTKGQR